MKNLNQKEFALKVANFVCEDIIERIGLECPRSDVADRIKKIIRKEQLIIETRLAMQANKQ